MTLAALPRAGPGSPCPAAPLPTDRLVSAIGRPGSDAAPTILRLADLLEVGQPSVRSAVRIAEAEGLVEPYRGNPAGPALTLTPLAASRLGLELRPDHRRSAASFRWAKADEPEAAARRRPRTGGRTVLESDLGVPIDVVGACSDDAGRLLDAIEAFRKGWLDLETLEAAAANGVYLVGSGEPLDPSHRPKSCPTCRRSSAASLAYCPRCDRSGIDGLLPAPPRRASSNGSGTARSGRSVR